MTAATWQLQIPLDAIIFDCDGTLSSIEGIDELAKRNSKGPEVEAITAEAMGKIGINPNIYKKRLDLVKPTHEQVIALGMEYFVHRVPHIEKLIALFKKMNKAIYIISAGLLPAITIFGKLLDIPPANIFAVNIDFDDQAHYLDFDHHSPLTTRDGKRLILTQLKSRHQHLAFVGDGLNDYAAHDLVSRFIGYGGTYYRENIAELCQFYIKIHSLDPLLPLCLTEEEHQNLEPQEFERYKQGLQAIAEGRVIIR